MSSKWRRFEVLLPLQFNDGSDVPAELLAEAVLEIVDHFGAASYETQKVEGHWRHGGVPIRDNLVKLVVDAPDFIERPPLDENNTKTVGDHGWNKSNCGWLVTRLKLSSGRESACSFSRWVTERNPVRGGGQNDNSPGFKPGLTTK